MSPHTKTIGYMVDLTRVMSFISMIRDIDSYGANVSVNYLAPFYKGITNMYNNIPIFKFENKNDYLTFKITLNEKWLETHNLLIFTPYIYNIIGKTVFASTDNNIFINKSLLNKKNEIKICVTASEEIAKKYLKKKYYISKLPVEYLNGSQLNILMRMGKTEKDAGEPVFTYIETTFHSAKHSDKHCDDHKYFTSKKIIKSLPQVLPPITNANTVNVITNFVNIKAYITSLFSTIYLAYPYLSNYTTLLGTATPAPVNFALTDFYVDFNLQKLTPPRNLINMQANNTGENYFMTNPISVATINNESNEPLYLYILYINQNSSGASLASDIQIYNSTTHNEIVHGHIRTGPFLPPMDYVNYPYPTEEEIAKYSDYGLYVYDMRYLNIVANDGADNLIFVERCAYNPTNLNQTIYSDINVITIYVGTALTSEQLTYLQTTYPNLTITNVNVPE